MSEATTATTTVDQMFAAYLAAVREHLTGQKERMREVVQGMSADGLNWHPPAEGETNSIAAMFAHLLESERFLLSAAVGIDVVRSREEQFETVVASADELLALMNGRISENEGYLAQLRPEHLAIESTRGPAHRRRTGTGAWFVAHAVEHGTEHLGHASLTRQMWEAQTRAS